MSTNNIPHIVDQGASIMPHERMKPLSDKQLHDIWKRLWEGGNIGHIAYTYARAIEKLHGIE